MRDQAFRIIGAFLLVLSFVVMMLAPTGKDKFSILNFFLFLGLFVVGVLLLLGLIGTDPTASRLRREARVAVLPRRLKTEDVKERGFRYPDRPWSRYVVVLVGLFLLAVGGVIGWAFPGSIYERFLAALPCCGTGIFLCWFINRHRRFCIKVDSNGLEARLYFRTVTMRWEDVVALVAHWAQVYRVYSQNRKIGFANSLEGLTELTKLISEVTGLAWR